MELEFETHSYKHNLLRLECDNKEIYGVIDRFSEGLILGPYDLYSKIKGISANFEKNERVAARTSVYSSLELSNPINSSSSSGEDLGVMSEGSSEFKSTSNGDSRKCQKLGFQFCEIEKLLEILEEDNYNMRKAFFAGVEERSELVSEVYRLFQVIQQRIRDHQTTDEKSLPGSLTSFSEDESTATGLPQVLLQATNPSLVTRVRKANIPAIQKPTSTEVL
ncbi:hypothetical protein C5167_023695 [Papaver somniferum]|uniref:Uncharacterized protein n=1 Tax=Papaver somniferum TaxID=3469 RepID=A0A4Y7JLI7_PAPSO|nr:uncharacterized protein LOC113277813 [Papaver somniferum]RZC61943.1 hypothetical protein C5167_023695 [Papaver somniferum]